MKTLDWSVETLGRECSSTGFGIHCDRTGVARETCLTVIIPDCGERTNFITQNLVVLLATVEI